MPVPRLVLATIGAGAILTGCFADDESSSRTAAARPQCLSAAPVPAVAPPARTVAARRPILFWREHPWPSLWSVRADGSRLRRVYRTRQNAKRPRLSPDRRWIAFDGASPGKPPISDFDVQIVRVDGTGRETLAESTDWEVEPAWSPDGKRLSFSRWTPHGEEDDWLQSQIWVVDADGRNLKRLGLGSGARTGGAGT